MGGKAICPICGSNVNVGPSGGGTYPVTCIRCGEYKLTDIALSSLESEKLTSTQAANFSGWIRENQGVIIKDRDLPVLRELRTPPVNVKATKLLRHLATIQPSPGRAVLPQLGAKSESGPLGLPTLLGICWAKDAKEVQYLLEYYLLNHKHYLDRPDGNLPFLITPLGWEYLSEAGGPTSNSAFVALWFHEDTHRAWLDAIQPGIETAGYQPVRIDKTEHNNRIDDEIEAAIRRAKFLVADFTGQRGGVYYEAGLARGQGKQVVWLCRRDELGKVHFDTRQYNFIVWEPAALEVLKTGLQNRIEATLGRGTYRRIG